MSIQKLNSKSRCIAPILPFFILQNQYFDVLSSASSIAIYAMIERCRYEGIAFNLDMIRRWSIDIGITENEVNESIKELISLNFIEEIMEWLI